MDTYFLPSIYRYLASHSELRVTETSGVAVGIAVLIGLVAREIIRGSDRPSGPILVWLRRFNVVLVPLLLVSAVTVVERFRLLS